LGHDYKQDIHVAALSREGKTRETRRFYTDTQTGGQGRNALQWGTGREKAKTTSYTRSTGDPLDRRGKNRGLGGGKKQEANPKILNLSLEQKCSSRARQKRKIGSGDGQCQKSLRLLWHMLHARQGNTSSLKDHDLYTPTRRKKVTKAEKA